MSWLMADRAGQSEHHYSAGGVFFFFLLLSPSQLVQDYFSAAVRHFAELLTRVCWELGSSYSRRRSKATFAAVSDGGGSGPRGLAADFHRRRHARTHARTGRRALCSPEGKQLGIGPNEGASTPGLLSLGPKQIH